MPFANLPFIHAVLGHLEYGIGIENVSKLRHREADIHRLGSRIALVGDDQVRLAAALSDQDIDLLIKAVEVCAQLEEDDFSTIVGCNADELLVTLVEIKPGRVGTLCPPNANNAAIGDC